MYNRYHGNSGFVERVDEAEPSRPAGEAPPPRRPTPPSAEERRPPSPLSGLSSELSRLLGRLSPFRLETEDLLLAAILYLLYRESHDTEFLFALVGILLF